MAVPAIKYDEPGIIDKGRSVSGTLVEGGVADDGFAPFLDFDDDDGADVARVVPVAVIPGVESVSRLVESFRFEDVDDDDDDGPAIVLLWLVDDCMFVAKAALAYGKPPPPPAAAADVIESLGGSDETIFLRSSGGVNASTSSSK